MPRTLLAAQAARSPHGLRRCSSHGRAHDRVPGRRTGPLGVPNAGKLAPIFPTWGYPYCTAIVTVFDDIPPPLRLNETAAPGAIVAGTSALI